MFEIYQKSFEHGDKLRSDNENRYRNRSDEVELKAFRISFSFFISDWLKNQSEQLLVDRICIINIVDLMCDSEKL